MDSTLHNANIICSIIPPECARLILQSMPRTHQLDTSFSPRPSLRHPFNACLTPFVDPLTPLLPLSCHSFHLILPWNLLIPIHVAHGNKPATCLIQPNKPLLHQGSILSTKLITPSWRLLTETTVSTSHRQKSTNYCQDYLQRFSSNLFTQSFISSKPTFHQKSGEDGFDTMFLPKKVVKTLWYHLSWPLDLCANVPNFFFFQYPRNMQQWPSLAVTTWPNYSYYS